MVYSCSKCHKAITEPMVSKCDNRFWHSSCLTCQMCGHTPSVVGEQSMYMFRGSLICKNDYMRINCVCKTCSRPLSQSDMVIKANGYGYMHDKCVYCGRCQHRLETGDRFMLTTDQMIVCQKCILQQHPQGPPPHSNAPPLHQQMVNPAPMGPMHHLHSNPAMGAHIHHHHHPPGHHPPPPQYPHQHSQAHSQQSQLGTSNHHGHHQTGQQFLPHSHSHHAQSSPNYSMMAPNGYSNNNGTMNGMYTAHHIGGSTGSNGNGPANGLSRATPPSTPNQPNTTNSGSSGSTTTGGGGGGRRGRKRNTQIKEEF